jgi:hypothetical protein
MSGELRGALRIGLKMGTQREANPRGVRRSPGDAGNLTKMSSNCREVICRRRERGVTGAEAVGPVVMVGPGVPGMMGWAGNLVRGRGIYHVPGLVRQRSHCEEQLAEREEPAQARHDETGNGATASERSNL